MAPGQTKENLLSSWKEIAVYLGCNQRTCLRWERSFGLPVHRMEGALKSRVFAYTDELDNWRRSRSGENLASNNTDKTVLQLAKSEALPKPRWRKSYYFLLPGLMGLLVYVVFVKMSGPSEPANFKIQNSTLIILTEEGKELWRFQTGIENLAEERTYREHFQFKRLEANNPYWPYLIIKDINHDGHPEILFTIKTQNEANEGELFCFDHKGKKLWKFRGGRELKFGSKIFSSDYRPRGFEVADFNNDGKLEVIAVYLHHPEWPTQLIVLDNNGGLMGEYWNSGHLADLAMVDLDGDGKKELIVSGNNNEYRKGCLIVFDSSSIQGRSPNTGEFRCEELDPGSEEYYILFPRTDVDLQEYPVEAIARIDILENHKLSVITAISSLIFELDYRLVPQDVIISHFFMQKHMTDLAAGKIKSAINEKYKQDLIKRVLYWDGQKWTNKPAVNLHWKEAKNITSSSK
jgi:hypothetical protein